MTSEHTYRFDAIDGDNMLTTDTTQCVVYACGICADRDAWIAALREAAEGVRGERMAKAAEQRAEPLRLRARLPPMTDARMGAAVVAFAEEGGGKGKTDFLHSPRAEAEYGPVWAWDVLAVTDMRGRFMDCANFNIDISSWDVRRVDDMGMMFHDAAKFDPPTGQWRVGNVGNMNNMFMGAVAFNQPIGQWDVRRVGQSMRDMFYGADAFKRPNALWAKPYAFEN